MANEIISYLEMCARERTSLQRGMNFSLGGSYSVILMSIRPGAPYRDRLENDGTTLIYEGHDVPTSRREVDPKCVDQPEFTPSGSLTENGKFHRAAQEFKEGIRAPEKVRVYEKLRSGVWSYNGVFRLIDSEISSDGLRNVFEFRLEAIDEDEDSNSAFMPDTPRRRVIPTSVKVEVWKRDQGKCVICGAEDELHFDHVLPYSKGGTSTTPKNVQLLCARHNLQKSDNIL